MREIQLKKGTYVSPTISVENVEIENSIAVSSSTATVTGPGTPNRPEIEGWTEQTVTKDIDFEF